MKKIYHQIEILFEKVTAIITVIHGNSITFIIVLGITIYWFCNKQFYTQGIHDSIRDIIHGVSFLSLFIIQKSFNRFSGSLHLKVNELVASHKPANNALINVEEKTEKEISILSKVYADLSNRIKKKS